ncbi:hypothetical protein N7476_011345 [Penicillium atrosanguineum]|uniref:Xylanolytic transcriptional activator regulatory domain-containing protein n=1 Tax=Penicillium atrosanguineum TaxID=1132637 RepID=A0A9W9PNU8_9EURO|nr:hypothetical protein N7476_011345 [Penicillium atrosanguineum]
MGERAIVHVSRQPGETIDIDAGEEEGFSAGNDLPSSCECLYIGKQKPGIKTGAVDSLNRRLDVLEKILLDESGKRRPQFASVDRDEGYWNINYLSSSRQEVPDQDHSRYSSQRHQKLDAGATASNSPGSPPQASYGSQKRRRINDKNPDLWDEDDVPHALPSSHLLDAIVNIHFQTVHHWVPILHEARFRAKLANPDERYRLVVLLHSLIAIAIRYIDLDKFNLSRADAERQIKVSRRVVMLHAMQSLSIESIQALVFLAFDFMGCGHPLKAWPIIGSLTRTVEYLQLTVEPPELSLKKPPLLRPLALLSLPRDWTESEERRRLFWNVFLLDRVCSVTSGWHTSLTSDHVQRRLPCSGAPWKREEAVSTPFFGIWNRSTAKIGKSIVNVPTLYESPSKTSDYSPGGETGGSGGSGNEQLDISNLGAFAYCIEATENLSQVTSFFLQQTIDFGDREQVKNWLTRFKELDLRLVHWKMFLPRQWNDSDVSRDVSVIKMDPNLTLAHMTHNAAMILLHQHIAYPPKNWCDAVKLPSACSAETCQLAAVEIASIAEKYLCYMGGIINSQFAFCAFVAARVLLVNWLSSPPELRNHLTPEFFNLVDSLKEMSRRWKGSPVGRLGDPDLMTKYATRLQLMLSQYAAGLYAYASVGDILSDASLDGLFDRQQLPMASGDPFCRDMTFPSTQGMGSMGMNFANFAPTMHPTEIPSGSLTYTHPPVAYDPHGTPIRQNDTNSRQRQQQRDPSVNMSAGGPSMMMSSPSSITAVAGLLDLGMENNHNNNNGFGGEDDDELTAMSHMLLGQQFLEMDRVITLDGTDFFTSTGFKT